MILYFRHIKMTNVLMYVAKSRNPIKGWRQMSFAEKCLRDIYAK